MSLFKKTKPENPDPVSRLSNIEYNKNLWNSYSRKWTKQIVEVEDQSVDESARNEYIDYLGDEWGDKQSVIKVLDEFIFPYITKESVVAEIGCGGGRIAAMVGSRVKELSCFDISEDMLVRAKNKLISFQNISFNLSSGKDFSETFYGRFDFVYSFDVFVHLDLHTIWSYFKELKKIIKKDGMIFLHTSNLNAPDGWARFEKQSEYKVEGHYFISPEIIKILTDKANYEIVHQSEINENFYYKRDYLFILKNRL